MAIRNAAKMMLVQKGRVLLSRCREKAGNEYYTLPGGGQEQYETLEEAVVREVLEETGLLIRPEGLAAVFEEICTDPAGRVALPEYSHRVYFLFRCSLLKDTGCAPAPDKSQTGLDWVALDMLEQGLPLRPEGLGGDSAPGGSGGMGRVPESGLLQLKKGGCHICVAAPRLSKKGYFHASENTLLA